MFIEFGEINRKLLILIIYPIFIQLRKFIKKQINDNHFFDLFRFYFSYLLSIIFVLIIKHRSRSSITTVKSHSSKEIIYNGVNNPVWVNPLKIQEENLLKEKKIKSIIYIILLTIIGLLTNIFYFVFRIINNDEKNNLLSLGKQSIGAFFQIIYFLILSKIILKKRVYKHHFISLIIIIFNLLLLIINYCKCFKGESVSIFIFYFFYYFLFSLSYIYGKKYLNIFYASPYSLMIKIGGISLIIIMIYDIIAYIICENNNTDFHGIIIGFKNNFNFSAICFFLLDIIFYFLSNIGILLTIYYFIPFHYIISESISEYIYYAYDCFLTDNSNYKTVDIIIYMITYIIILFFSLVFNEIIILNFCNLSYNIKKNIEKRELEDIFYTTRNSNLSIVSTDL